MKRLFEILFRISLVALLFFVVLVMMAFFDVELMFFNVLAEIATIPLLIFVLSALCFSLLKIIKGEKHSMLKMITGVNSCSVILLLLVTFLM